MGLERLNSLVEDRDMLAENLENLVKKERLEGLEIGEKQGGVKGEAKLLKRLIFSKYGQCPEWAQDKLNAADSDRLGVWAERIFTAETLEKLLSD